MLKTSDSKLKLILFIIVFLLYANTIGHDYAWDDSIVITENPRVKKGISGIPDLFLKYNSDYKADKYGYRPIVLTSFAIEYGLFADKPSVSHFMNIIYFAILCMVAFSVLRKLFYRLSNLGPFLVCLLFAVHPIHVEVVANIKSRDEIFGLLFALLSLNQLINYYTGKKIKSLLFSFLLFILAFLSKENSITFLGVMFLSLLYMEGRVEIKKFIKPMSYLFILLVVCGAIVKLSSESTFGTNLSKGAGIYHEKGIQGNSFFYSNNPGEKIANALTVLYLYLKNFLFPTSLLYFYGYNQVPVANWSQPLVIISLLVQLALVLFAILRFKKNREISYGLIFYFITISVYTHLFRTFADTMADRFLFMPSLGLCIVVVFGLASLLKADLTKSSVDAALKQSNPAMVRLKYSLLVILILLSLRTFVRNKAWKNNLTLTTTDMPALENCARAHNYYADNLKLKLLASYDASIEADMIHHYRRSIEISKESFYSFLGLGNYLCSVKRYNEGIALLDSMLQIYPEAADPHYYIGEAYVQTGQFPKAISHLETSLKLAPEVLNTYYELSIAYSRHGEYEKAMSTIMKAKEKFSESSYIYEALGNIYFDKGDMEQATKYTLEMLRFGANPQTVYRVVIGRYQFRKQDSLASKYYKEAISKGIFRPGGQ